MTTRSPLFHLYHLYYYYHHLHHHHHRYLSLYFYLYHHQTALGVISDPAHLTLSSEVSSALVVLYQSMGDHLAQQYGGSEAQAGVLQQHTGSSQGSAQVGWKGGWVDRSINIEHHHPPIYIATAGAPALPI